MVIENNMSLVFNLALFASVLLSAFAALTNISNLEYDVLVVGGGPSGLSALSGLARIRRRAILFDSGAYRNIATRHMHDVIGNDGTIPAVFREKARSQIAKYPTVEMINATISSIENVNNGSYFVATDSNGQNYTGRKVILGTGMKDIIPDSPDLKQLFGKGVFWCPWCDGYEHRDQPIGLISNLSLVMNHVLDLPTLYNDIAVYVNGTYTDESVAALSATHPGWLEQLSAYNITVDNRTISSITRLNVTGPVNSTELPDGSAFDAETDTEYDRFLLTFSDQSTVERSAFLVVFPTSQASELGSQLGVKIENDKLMGNLTTKMKTNVAGVWAVGDANSDGSTNVPHAMWSGKAAAVNVCGVLADEDAELLVASGKSERKSKRGESMTSDDDIERLLGRDLEVLWESTVTEYA